MRSLSAKHFLTLLGRLVVIFRCVSSPFLRRHSNNVHPTKLIENKVTCTPPSTPEVINEDHFRPCLERLDSLEKLLDELHKKPAGMPEEKEKILLNSMDRIKSVEHDLEKTKKALHAAVTKQIEIAELIDNWSQARCRRRWLCLNG